VSTSEWTPSASIEALPANPDETNFEVAIARFEPIAVYTDRFEDSMAARPTNPERTFSECVTPGKPHAASEARTSRLESDVNR
jgi:hypothetical protein